MNKNANDKLTKLSQTLRKGMTKEERKLWYEFLKGLPVTVHRQKVFGQYIADFYISDPKTIIELDGSQHYSEDGLHYDEERNAFFRSQGVAVLRYSNYDVNSDFEAVCTDILKNLGLLK